MSRKPSPETLLKNAQRTIRALQADLARMRQEMLMYKERSGLFQKDRDEWKARFDKLLERMPEDPL
jgi:predicted phage tail protein